MVNDEQHGYKNADGKRRRLAAILTWSRALGRRVGLLRPAIPPLQTMQPKGWKR